MRCQAAILKSMQEFDALPREFRDLANKHGLKNVQAIRAKYGLMPHDMVEKLLDQASPVYGVEVARSPLSTQIAAVRLVEVAPSH